MEIFAIKVDNYQTELVVTFSPVFNGTFDCLDGYKIGYLWWGKVTGREEAKMVIDFEYFLEDSVASSL